MSRGVSLVEADDPATLVSQISDIVGGAPGPALVLDRLLRQNARLPAYLGLGNESLACRGLHCPRPGRRIPLLSLDRGGRVWTVARHGVVEIIVSHPQRHNALTQRLGRLLADALVAAAASEGQIVLCGQGPDFCGDLAETPQVGGRAVVGFARLRPDYHLGHLIHRYRDRIVVRLHGRSGGAGIELAAFAHRVEADPSTRISLPHLARGRILDSGGTVSLTARIGRWRAAALALSGMELDAATAHRWSLVDCVVDPSARCDRSEAVSALG